MFSLLLIALLQLQPIQMLREDPDRAGGEHSSLRIRRSADDTGSEGI